MTERENLKRLLAHKEPPAWMPIDVECFDLLPFLYDVIAERPLMGLKEGRDWFGCGWVFNPDTNGWAPMHEPPICSDITKWREQVVFPDLEQVDWEKAAQVASTWDRENKMSFYIWESGCWERLHALVGFEEALIALYEEPEAVHELMDAIAEHKIKVVEKMAQYMQPDIVCIFDDFGYQRAPFMSSEMFCEFIQPYDKRVGDALKEHGIIYAHHSCGKIDDLFEDILDMGPEIILGLFLPYNDAAKIAEEYSNRIVIMAGSNTQKLLTPGISEEESVEETKKLLDIYAPYKNLIFDVVFSNPENVPAMMATAKTYGQQRWYAQQ